MHVLQVTWLAAILAIAQAREPLPARTTILPPKTSKHRPFSASSNSDLQRRQDNSDYDTLVEIGDGTSVAQDLDAGPDESPQAFGQLWDWIENEACTSQGCSSRVEHCVTASAGQDVCVTVDGSFLPDLRETYIKGARGAFDRSVQTRRPGTSGVIETGTNLIRVLGDRGEASGYNIDVEIYNQDSTSDGEGCPDVIEFIASAGSQIPGMGSYFGLVGFLCQGASVAFEGQATG